MRQCTWGQRGSWERLRYRPMHWSTSWHKIERVTVVVMVLSLGREIRRSLGDFIRSRSGYGGTGGGTKDNCVSLWVPLFSSSLITSSHGRMSFSETRMRHAFSHRWHAIKIVLFRCTETKLLQKKFEWIDSFSFFNFMNLLSRRRLRKMCLMCELDDQPFLGDQRSSGEQLEIGDHRL